MNFPWFKRTGIIFIPNNVFGWLIMLSATGYAAYRFIDIDSRSHSVSDTLMNFAFNLFLIGVAYTITGFLTSRSKKN